jgi:hypothetical protein
VEQTILMTGDIERLTTVERSDGAGSGDEVIRAIGLGLAGRLEEASRALRKLREGSRVSAFQSWADFLLAWLERRPADMRAIRRQLDSLEIMGDPEAIFQEGWMYCDAGEHDLGLELLRRALAKGYFVATTLAGSPQFDALRHEPEFQKLLAECVAGRDRALAAFRDGGGMRLLGR